MLKPSLSAAIAALLVACGGPTMGDTSSASNATKSDCPPVQKGNGLMVGSRFDYDDLAEMNTWRETMFARSCAGVLGDLIPDLPAGHGVVPDTRPYIMNDRQVYLSYAPLPDPLYFDEMANVPPDIDRINFEIVQFSEEEMTKLQTWLDQNSDDFLSGRVADHDVYLLGGFATLRPGKGDRLATSLHFFVGDNTVVRISHKSLFTQTPGLQISPIVESYIQDITERAKRAGY
ncbi:MAG: hypothetical protein AAFN91_13270 [Pseudomonadota bacterium]